MYFEKEQQIVNIDMETGIASYDNWDELKISGFEEIENTIEKIEFLEQKWFRVSV